MNPARALLGIYLPGDTWWHRRGVGAKYLVVLALIIPAALCTDPLWSLGLAAASALLVATTGAPLRLAWGIPWGLVVVVGAIAAYHVVVGHAALAVTVACALLVALYATRLLLFTTPTPALVDAVVAATAPLRAVGFDPERFGLAVAIMLRSVPYLAGAVADLQDAARARGLERHQLTLLAPVVVEAVAYARRTGDALAARGLGEGADAGASTLEP